MRRALRLALAVALLSSPAGLALDSATEPRFTRLSTTDGLSHNSVYTALQDRRGFLWFGTEDGLNRFDGYRFRIFRHAPEDPDSIAASDVSVLLESKSGDLWVGTWGGGLDRFDPASERFHHLRHDPEDPNSLADSRIQALYEDPQGRLWIGTYDQGLDLLDPATGEIRHHRHDPDDDASLSHDHVWTLTGDDRGHIWVGTEGGLDRLDPATGRFEHFRHDPARPGSLADDNVRSLHLDTDGTLWVGTARAVHRFQPQDGSFTVVAGPEAAGDKADAFITLHRDRSGNLWAGSQARGLWMLDPATGQHRRFRPNRRNDRGLSHENVRAVFEDRSGNLWAATRGGGINRLDLKPTRFRRRDPDPEARAHHSVAAILETAPQELWVGTEEGLLQLLPPDDRGRSASRLYRHDPQDPRSLAANPVRALLTTADGTVWIGTHGGGLHRQRRNRPGFDRFRHRPDDPASLPHDRVSALATASDGRIWVGTLGGGVGLFDPPSGTTRRYPMAGDAGGLDHDRVSSLVEDRHGQLWIGSEGGLHRLDPSTGEVHHWHHDPRNPETLPHNQVFALLETAEGELWVGTAAGLSLKSPTEDRFTTWTETDGLPNDVVFALLEDEDGNLWLTTNGGLARFSAATRSIRSFGTQDGLPPTGFREGAAFRSPRGEMFVGSVHGLFSFDPRQIRDNPFVPPVYLTDFQIFNRPAELPGALWSHGAIELDHRSSLISFEFAALEYTSPQHNQYSYKLENFDEDWIPAPDRRAVYHNLPAGDYVLRVRGSNSDGVWNYDGASLALRIHPPLWGEVWFLALCALAVLAVLWLLHRWRTLRIERRNRELERIVAHRTAELAAHSDQLEAANREIRRFAFLVSHDLRAPLVTLKGFLGEMRTNLETARRRLWPLLPELAGDARRELTDTLGEGAEESLHFIEISADRMDTVTQGILDLARVGGRKLELEPVDLGQLVDDLLPALARRIEQAGAQIEVGPLPTVVADRFSLERALQNLLTNALTYRHPDRPLRVRISGEHGDTHAVVRVEDNGRGIAEEDLPRIFEIFQRVGEQNSEGLGMGLSYARAMIRQHQGRLDCRSQLGAGTTFIITLPNEPPASVVAEAF